MCTHSNPTLDKILNQIIIADDFQINEIIKAVIRRYEILFPDNEVSFLSLPKKNIEERNRVLEAILSQLQK